MAASTWCVGNLKFGQSQHLPTTVGRAPPALPCFACSEHTLASRPHVAGGGDAHERL